MTLFRPVISQKTKDEVGKLFPNVPHFGDKVNAMVHHYKVLISNKNIIGDLTRENQVLTSKNTTLRHLNNALIAMIFINVILFVL